MTKAELETTLRWDEDERAIWACTTSPVVRRKWERLGYPVQVLGMARDGEPRSWECRLPMHCLAFRRLDRPKRVMSDAHRAALMRGRLSNREGRSIDPAADGLRDG